MTQLWMHPAPKLRRNASEISDNYIHRSRNSGGASSESPPRPDLRISCWIYCTVATSPERRRPVKASLSLTVMSVLLPAARARTRRTASRSMLAGS